MQKCSETIEHAEVPAMIKTVTNKILPHFSDFLNYRYCYWPEILFSLSINMVDMIERSQSSTKRTEPSTRGLFEPDINEMYNW